MYAAAAKDAPSPDTDDPLYCKTFDLGEEYEIASADAPCEPPAGGDFHAAFPLEDGTVALVMGDVVGHGSDAAERAGALCRAIGGCLIEGLPPGDALGFVNAAAEMSPEFEGFATAFAGTIAPKTGVLTYANGGHEPPLVSDPARDTIEKSIRELEPTGPPIGVIGADETRYHERTVHLSKGETLLLYTDGVTETRRGAKMLGPDGLRRFLIRCRWLPPLRLVRKLIGYARAFAGQGRWLRDDAAALALRRRHAQPAEAVSSRTI